MAPFDFQNLQLHRQQIRLFHLQPGEFHDPISATLSIAYLGDCPKYEALSYVWGDPNVCFDITVGGHTVPVTINSWAALRRLRGVREERVLWIDSHGIKQSDGIEKTYQVGLMTEIYRNTWRGLAWLGEFEEDAVLKPGMDLESYQDSGVTMDKNHAQLAFRFMDKLSKLSTDGHFTIETENVLPGWVSVTRPEVTTIHRLVNLRYFTRIWTVQEFVLPPRVELVLGNAT
ncbi:hypothetical protein INS49_005013 [Diaporthe citri]|uniref:uncharacterized protein n=1 Tax=Diaporthe citri TaxID=83186 RepID=UPI001C82446B|nr:uncharacterized protein INS49_005013 [Diaporthe citri]KAG6354042.1 hypothetical protein INS49_005013 [Diaporthe citri]